jgi:hypothetical protein
MQAETAAMSKVDAATTKTADGDVSTATATPISPKKHAMTATWHTEDPSTWNFFQHLIIKADILQQGINTPQPPVHSKEDKVPYYPVYKQWMWILPRAVAPIAIHRLFMEATGMTFHPVFAFI